MLKLIGRALAVLFLLVVVALVAIPIFSAKRGGEAGTTCYSREKQVGLALLSYLQDYDERFPPPYRGAPQGWAGRVQPYIKSDGLFRCPDDVVTEGSSPDPAAVVVSYALNSNLKEGTAAFQSSKADDPAETVMAFEVSGDQAEIDAVDEGTRGYTAVPKSGCLSASGDGIGPIPEWGWLGVGPSPLRYATGAIGGSSTIAEPGRHNGRANYGALDGHVKWLRPEQVSGGTTNPSGAGKQDQPPGAAAGTTAAGHVMTFSTH